MSNFKKIKTECNLTIINSLPGNGKTHLLKQEMRKQKTGFIFLCFNADIREKMLNENTDICNKENTLTVHALCYQTLELNNKLPESFKNKENEIAGKDFDKLITEYLKLSNEEQRSYFLNKNIQTIFVEEYQDFSLKFVKILKTVIKICSLPDIFITGDETQTIYSFFNKKKVNNFQNIKNDFPEYSENIKEINLNRNHRIQSNTLLLFLNDFYKKNFNLDDRRLYEVQNYNESDIKPILKMFSNFKEEYQYVHNEAEKYVNKGKSVLILSRYNKAVKLYKEMFKNEVVDIESIENDNKVNISTVHKQKGLQADVVFLINYNLTENDKTDLKEELCVLNVGITRMKYNLVITSSQKITNNFFTPFNLNYFDYENRQIKKAKLFNNLIGSKKIHDNKNFTCKKLNNNMIDKLTFEVNLNDCPFYRYIPKELKSSFENKYKILFDDLVTCTIRFNHVQNKYYFEFFDLKILHKNNFSDKQIIHYIYNKIIELFDYRIEADKIKLNNIDLQRYYFFDDEHKYIQSKYETVKSYYLNNKFSSAKYSNELNKYKKLSIQNVYDIEAYRNIDDNSIYFNMYSKYMKGISVVVYNPNTKDNNNVIHINNFFKVEYRLRKSTLDLNLFKLKYNCITLCSLLNKDYEYYLEMFNYIKVNYLKME